MLPTSYAKNVLESTANKLKEFDNAEYLLMTASEDATILWRSQARTTTRIAFLRMLADSTSSALIAELKSLSKKNADKKILAAFGETCELMLALQYRLEIITTMRINNMKELIDGGLPNGD